MNTIAKKSVSEGYFITKNEMDALTTAYKQERWAANSDRLGKSDSMSVWLTVDELETFLERVKINGGNGVRLHFAVYGNDFVIPEQAGQQAVVMVANRSKDGSLQNAKELYTEVNGKPEIIAYLPAPACPPFCGGGLGTTTTGLGKATLVIRGDNNMEVI
jgi:hypothetical protein